jgi:hypothetical protein
MVENSRLKLPEMYKNTGVEKINKNKYIIRILTTSGLYYKQVTIVIYDRNDSGLYYKTRDDRN